VKLVADSFTWPFRGEWRSRWAVGLVAVLLIPILFVPLLGYAMAATREAELDPASGPPRWTLSGRLLADGLWTALAILGLTLPFALVFPQLSRWLLEIHVFQPGDVAGSRLVADALAMCILALPWGLVLLLLMPHAAATFAASGRPRDLFDAVAAFNRVRRDFTTWNLAAAAMVTAWAIGLACTGLFCVGLVPGIYYAILVSAHASAALHHEGGDSSAR
jgi:hypothetical protein